MMLQILEKQLVAFYMQLIVNHELYLLSDIGITESVKEIAVRFGISESKVKSSLFRTRNKLKFYLQKEGFFI